MSSRLDEANAKVAFYFRISRIKKLLLKTHLREKTIIFHLMTSGAKTIDLRSNMIEKRYPGVRRVPRCFLRILFR